MSDFKQRQLRGREKWQRHTGKPGLTLFFSASSRIFTHSSTIRTACLATISRVLFQAFVLVVPTAWEGSVRLFQHRGITIYDWRNGGINRIYTASENIFTA